MQDIGSLTPEALEQELTLFANFIMQFGESYLSDEAIKRWHDVKTEQASRRQRERMVEIRAWIPEPDILRWYPMVPVRIATEYPGDLLWWNWQGSFLLATLSFEHQGLDEQARKAMIEERAEAALQALGCDPRRREREWGIEKPAIRFWVSKTIYAHIGVDLKRPQIALDIAFIHPNGDVSIWNS